MRTTQITENLFQINRLHFVNAYLVREPDGFTLVDTTVGGSADGLIAAAREGGGEIRRIALTHGHSDHVGSLDALRKQLGDATRSRPTGARRSPTTSRNAFRCRRWERKIAGR